MNHSRQKITILGSTGSIGCNTLNVVAQNPERFKIIALSAKTNVSDLIEQCKRFSPQYASIVDSEYYPALKEGLQGLPTEALSGPASLIDLAELPESDTVVLALVGISGLRPGLRAVQAGKRILLANKEILVSAGALFMQAVAQHKVQLLPIDSEHNALFQCLERSQHGAENDMLDKVIITASGGPFLNTPLDELQDKTPQQACAHPNWEMGQKISVDSATMMNKGLEVIEARYLFDLEPEQIDVVIHPQSIVHAIVQWKDGSAMAHFSQPDMCIPIAHALAWPQRLQNNIGSVNLAEIGQLLFEPVDLKRFPCLGFAYQAMREGESSLIALNAANEVAVADFLAGQIHFSDIASLIEQTLELVAKQDKQLDPAQDIEAIFAIHEMATHCAARTRQSWVQSRLKSL